jgi:hypothetical protein
MRFVIGIEAVLVSIAGFALWFAIGDAVRRNVYMLDHRVVVSTHFTVALLAAVGVAAMLIIRGVSVAQRTGTKNNVFAFVEAPLTLLVGAALVWIVNAWRIVGDMGPTNPIGMSDRLPIVLTAILHKPTFYLLTVGFIVAAVGAFARTWRGGTTRP